MISMITFLDSYCLPWVIFSRSWLNSRFEVMMKRAFMALQIAPVKDERKSVLGPIAGLSVQLPACDAFLLYYKNLCGVFAACH